MALRLHRDPIGTASFAGSSAAEFLAFQTVCLITDNRDLLADAVASTSGLSHWPMVAAWWKERIRHVGPMVSTPQLYSCPYRQTQAWTSCILLGLARLRLRIREHTLLIRGKPRNNNLALLSSCQSRIVLRTLRPLTCGHRLQMLRAILRMRSTLVGQNRRVPTQLSERK